MAHTLHSFTALSVTTTLKLERERERVPLVTLVAIYIYCIQTYTTWRLFRLSFGCDPWMARKPRKGLCRWLPRRPPTSRWPSSRASVPNRLVRNSRLTMSSHPFRINKMSFPSLCAPSLPMFWKVSRLVSLPMVRYDPNIFPFNTTFLQTHTHTYSFSFTIDWYW